MGRDAFVFTEGIVSPAGALKPVRGVNTLSALHALAYRRAWALHLNGCCVLETSRSVVDLPQIPFSRNGFSCISWRL